MRSPEGHYGRERPQHESDHGPRELVDEQELAHPPSLLRVFRHLRERLVLLRRLGGGRSVGSKALTGPMTRPQADSTDRCAIGWADCPSRRVASTA